MVSSLPPVDQSQPQHALSKRLDGWRLVTVVATAVVAVLVVSMGAVAAVALRGLTGSIQTVELPGREQPVWAGIGELEGGFNVLIIGSDTRAGQGDGFGDVDSELNDVTILIHVSEDHEHATVMSLPRDMLVDVPGCVQEDGSLSTPRTMTPINATLGIGGMPCVVATVEELTGLDIGYAGVMTFTGVAQLSSALGGVDVCVTEPIYDPWSGLDLPEAGWHELEGLEALAFLRTRKTVGDGSDLARISTQQVFMAALVRALRSDGVLRDLRKLYGIAEVATRTMVLSSSLGGVDVMVSMALALRNISPENIVFIQFPVVDAPPAYPGRVVPDQALADAVLEKVRADEQFVLDDDSGGRGSVVVDPPGNQAVSPPPPSEEQETTPPEPGDVVDAGGTDSSVTPAPQDPPAPGVDQVTEAEVISGLVGQSGADVTCAVVR